MVLTDNQKIGIGLVCLGSFLMFLGVLLLFDAALIAMGNISFLAGLCVSIGMERTMSLFTRKMRGTALFFLGIFLIVFMRWGLVGMIVEGFGFMNLFGNFLPIALTAARQVPLLSTFLSYPGISNVADFICGAATKPKFSV